ncbi:beta-glucuronidase [Thermogemmatispora sp.]|uniref:beta-glucuronidase n=1 Tax=Thermogemmatispora sp. TaxID=1968838 RepID=UPI001D4DC5FF|nr:beta-glucuronidase [Thermogemmatispora sp.]MBX5451178.1 beta-glucuronidase [Thermogemmatispora sp.]
MLYPLMTATREVFDLSGIWQFRLDPGQGLAERWYERPLRQSVPMPVPASYNELGEEAAYREHVGRVWYERELIIPRRLWGQRLVLRFGAVAHTAHVYLNGQPLITHRGGFTPFEAEITALAQPGKNRLTVLVDNTLDYSTLPVAHYREEPLPDGTRLISDTPNFDFFNYAGIHRPVRLYTTPATYIRDIVLTSTLAEGDGLVGYRIAVEGAERETVTVRVTLLDAEGRTVAAGEGTQGQLRIKDVHLWEPGHPYLYTCRVELWRPGETSECLDSYEEPYGVRTVAVEDGQFLLNGKPFYFKGCGKHEDFPVHGRGFDEAVYVKDLSLLRWLGANSFRTSHYPYAEEVMRLADRLGLVVIDEVPAVGLHLNLSPSAGPSKRQTWRELTTAAQHEQALRELIARDKNHACVVMWSIANEPATEEEGARAYFEPLLHLARQLDPQRRPLTIALQMLATPATDTVTDLLDVIALNRYYGWYVHGGRLEAAQALLRAELEAWRQRLPGKPILLSEYGADAIAGLHDEPPTMFSEEYQAALLQAYHEVLDACPAVIGEHVWNFADFQTGQSITRVQGNRKGIFTRERRPKLAAHLLRKRWRAIPDFGYKAGK